MPESFPERIHQSSQASDFRRDSLLLRATYPDLSSTDRYWGSAITIDPSCIDTTKIVGFILNVPTNYKVGFVRLPIQRRHWIAVRQINKEYWNLDSKLDAPQCLGDEANMLQYLREQLQSNDKELFIVCTKEVEKSQQWLLPENGQG
ncbi:AGAP005226-PA-like protein [Anopheles sinensis]|uniref:ubiquitinyl hydrolase 1 n=1 Tax=Anopheles sinensis TaxID=74873 RepID=A0A084WCP1_ANOSI|nr:AGAP005226-PA-like protein [Anopheles sinensis]